MDAVVTARQHDVTVLQDHDPLGQPPVRVGPLVNLISHRDEDGAQEQVRAEGIPLVHVSTAPCQQVPGHFAEQRQRDHEVVPVRLDEVVPGNRRGIDVVLPEWPQKVLQRGKVQSSSRRIVWIQEIEMEDKPFPGWAPPRRTKCLPPSELNRSQSRLSGCRPGPP